MRVQRSGSQGSVELRSTLGMGPRGPRRPTGRRGAGDLRRVEGRDLPSGIPLLYRNSGLEQAITRPTHHFHHRNNTLLDVRFIVPAARLGMAPSRGSDTERIRSILTWVSYTVLSPGLDAERWTAPALFPKWEQPTATRRRERRAEVPGYKWPRRRGDSQPLTIARWVSANPDRAWVCIRRGAAPDRGCPLHTPQ